MKWFSIAAAVLVVSAQAAISVAQTPDPPADDSVPSAPSSPSAPPTQVDALKAQTDLATAEKGLLDAQVARAESQQRLAAARIGSVTGQSEIKGTTAVGQNGPRAEALLMATASTVAAGRRVRDAILPILQGATERNILVLTNRNELAVPDAIVFDMKIDLFQQAFVAAERRYADAVAQEPRRNIGQAHVAPLAVADAVIGNLARLGSYFQTNYQFGEVQPDLPPELLPAAVIQSFDDLSLSPRFVIPSHSLALDPTPVFHQLRSLQDSYLQAAAHRATARQRAAALREMANADPSLKAVALLYEESAEALNLVITRYDAFSASLEAAAEGSEPLIVRVVRQKQIQQLLAASPSPLALLLTGRTVGAYYTRSNLWTFLGGPPLYTMAGSTTTYTLFEPATGRVLRSGAVPHHAGYRSVRQVERLFSSPSTGTRP